MTTRVLFTTQLPVPYQVELFDALAAGGRIDPIVIYGDLRHPSRAWDVPPMAHRHRVMTAIDEREGRRLLDESALAVFSGYETRRARALIAARAASGEPWAFWGERPGFLLPPALGRFYRAAMMPALRRADVPIWGIGQWAIEGYAREYGRDRRYCNVPYFSNLQPFLGIDRHAATTPPRRILFSGSLIARKGIDLLLQAFLVISAEFPLLELDIVGEGPLREQLVALAAPVAARVHFRGFRQWAELPAAYAAADVLAAPSRYDGWGLIVPEGLAAGLLTISTDRTGSARELIDAETGWVIEAGRLAPLVAALRAAVTTEGVERQRRIARGRERAAAQDVGAGAARVVAAVEACLCGSSLAVASHGAPAERLSG